MRRFSAFLQASAYANVPHMFSSRQSSSRYPALARRPGRASGKDHARSIENADISLNLHCDSSTSNSTFYRVSRQPLALLTSLAGSLLLAACGFEGTDRNQDSEPRPAAAASESTASADAFEEVELADSEPRPTMQLQVVLDRRGFGPGVIPPIATQGISIRPCHQVSSSSSGRCSLGLVPLGKNAPNAT